jgi:hypothetical protein
MVTHESRRDPADNDLAGLGYTLPLPTATSAHAMFTKETRKATARVSERLGWAVRYDFICILISSCQLHNCTTHETVGETRRTPLPGLLSA